MWRFVGTSHFTEGHRHSVLYLFGALLAGSLPWTIFFPSIGAALWRTRRMIGRHDPQTFLLLWILVVFAFYAVASSKRGVYLLALYPALFLLLGWWVDTARRSVVGIHGLARLLPPLAWLMAWLCGGIAILVTLTHVGLPLTDVIPDLLGGRTGRDAKSVVHAIGADATTIIALFGSAACAAAAGALVAARQRWELLLICLIVATSAVAVAVRRVVMPAIATTTTRGPFVDTVRRIAGPDGRLAAYRSFDYGFVYYWGSNVAVQDEPLSASSPPLLIADDTQWARATAAERRLFERVPFIESPRGSNTGRLIVLQRRAGPAPSVVAPAS